MKNSMSAIFSCSVGTPMLTLRYPDVDAIGPVYFALLSGCCGVLPRRSLTYSTDRLSLQSAAVCGGCGQLLPSIYMEYVVAEPEDFSSSALRAADMLVRALLVSESKASAPNAENITDDVMAWANETRTLWNGLGVYI